MFNFTFPEDIMVSEIRQRKVNTLYYLYIESKNAELIKTQSKMGVTYRALGVEE